MTWNVLLVDEVDDWYLALEPELAHAVADVVDMLVDAGPTLSRPTAGQVDGSKIHNLKELCITGPGGARIRILFCFDSDRNAVLLVAADKAQHGWKRWYRPAIREAEARYQKWQAGGYGTERK
jgi:hypothetical protein